MITKDDITTRRLINIEKIPKCHGDPTKYEKAQDVETLHQILTINIMDLRAQILNIIFIAMLNGINYR